MRYTFECSMTYDADVITTLKLGKFKGKDIYSLPAAELAAFKNIFKAIWPFWLAMLLSLIILAIFPQTPSFSPIPCRADNPWVLEEAKEKRGGR